MATVHRLGEDEIPAVLALLAARGGTARSLDSWRQDRMTALVLGSKESLVAAMPMSLRRIRIAPGRELSVGWLSSNQFASRMSLRRQTRDTVPQWAPLLPEADALVVLRRDESSLAARWYAQTGFEDILSVRCLYLDMAEPPIARAKGPQAGLGTGRYHVRVVSPLEHVQEGGGGWGGADASRWQSEMLGVYLEVYGAHGGPQVRSPDFWLPTLAHHYYREHYQFQIIGLWNSSSPDSANLIGYAVVGWSGWHSKRPRMDILELATRQWDTGVAADLIQTTCQLAWSESVRQVRAVISVHDPYRGHLARTGFTDRWGYVMMAKWLHAQRYLDQLVAASGQREGCGLPAELGDVQITIAAPGEVPLSVHRAVPGRSADVIQVQGDHRAITRLLLHRLDSSAATQDGRLTTWQSEKLSESAIARLSLAFPWAPWAFHMLDYI